MRKYLSIVKKCGSNEPVGHEGAAYEISRRSFLGSTALVVLPALCGGCADDGVTLVDLPAVSNKTIAISLDEFPMLKSVGGSIIGQASGHANPIVIARVSDDMFAALDAICTHERCTVSYNALNLTLDCPCHGSTYEVDGRVINGPAVRALPRFTATASGTMLTITLP
jgi:Rieske Fe-S protein